MKLINTLVFAVIAGILISTEALGKDERRKGLLQSIFELGRTRGKVNSNTFNEKMRVVDQLLKESCEKNSGPHAFPAAKKGLQYFLNCQEPEMNEIQSTTLEENFVITLKKHCAMYPTEKNCFKQFRNSIEPCLGLEERKINEITYEIVNSALQFICDIDGARITKFAADGGVKCTHSKRQALFNCANEFTNHFNSTTSSDDKSANGGFDFLPIVAGFKVCGDIEKFQDCSVKVLNECEHHTASDIVNALFNSIREGIDCTKFHTSGATAASSAINVILITIVMAILPRF